MNSIIVTSANQGCYGWLFQEHLKQRKRLFVDQHKWEIPHDSEVEHDQYDRPDTVYILIEDRGELIGYTRLLPTISQVTFGTMQFSYMVKDAVEGLLPGIPQDILFGEAAPVGHHVWEMTRFHARDRTTMKTIFNKAAEFLMSRGATHTVSFTRTSYKSVLNACGLPTKKIGSEVRYNDGRKYCVLETDLTRWGNEDKSTPKASPAIAFFS